MTTETMTVHQALVEIKTLEARFTSILDSFDTCRAVRNSDNKVNGVTRELYKQNNAAAKQKFDDLVKRYIAIKEAIVISNSVTKITVCGETMTMAIAIWRKDKGLHVRRSYLSKIQNEYSHAQAVLNRENGDRLQDAAIKYAQNMFANKENIDVEQVARLKDEYLKANTFDLIDNISVLREMEDTQDYLDRFFAEVDGAISTSNALTTLEITY